ncbi:MAG: hypothetical protein ABJB66_05860 [Gemmatimonadaceae bacterium]
MSFRTAVPFILMSFRTGVLCILAISAGVARSASAQTPIPAKIMQQLSLQLRHDVPAMRDCTTKSKYPFTARAVDLNGDSKPEYLLASASECECGQVNCSQWVYRANDKAFDLLLEAEGYVLNIGATSHRGYRDLRTTSRNSAAIVNHVSYAFRGVRYERAGSTIENLDTHESKPTERAIQFVKGASSATITGSASAGFPDSWTFKAQKGQTVTMNLQSASEPKTSFTLVAPGTVDRRMITDNQTKWNGALPVDGVYTILVDTKGDGRATYSLTMAIH